jgi:protein-disulfide isomerase
MLGHSERPGRLAQLRSVLDLVAVVAFIVVCVLLAWALVRGRPAATLMRQASARPAAPPAPPPPAELVSIGDAPVRGNGRAPVVLIEFSDFQCPYCGAFARTTLPRLEQQYVATGKVQLAFRNLPLPMHPFAEKAAEAAACAGRDGKFWAMHDRLFADQQHLDAPGLLATAATLGLEGPAFAACLHGQTAATLGRDVAQARAWGVTGTPTFFLGLRQADGRVQVTKRLTGALPLATFVAALDAVLVSAASETPATK